MLLLPRKGSDDRLRHLCAAWLGPLPFRCCCYCRPRSPLVTMNATSGEVRRVAPRSTVKFNGKNESLQCAQCAAQHANHPPSRGISQALALGAINRPRMEYQCFPPGDAVSLCCAAVARPPFTIRSCTEASARQSKRVFHCCATWSRICTPVRTVRDQKASLRVGVPLRGTHAAVLGRTLKIWDRSAGSRLV